MSQRQYSVLWSARARFMLAAIPDRRIQKKIFERVRDLSSEPEKQGKPLIGELAGYRSLRAVGQRYRIIFRVEDEKVLVLIVALGLRKAGSKKDVYALAKRLVQLGLVEASEKDDGVRQIVEEYKAVEDDPLFDIVGAGEGVATDGSEEHDNYLYGNS